MLCLDVDQHLGDNGAGGAGVYEGQVGQEEIHRGVEMLVRTYSQNDEHIPQHGDQVHGHEEPKQESLLVWVWREAQKQEVRGSGLISDSHLK